MSNPILNDSRILPSSAAALAEAAARLRSGGLVAFPTETVYGLGGNAFDADAVALIYSTKGRPAHNPLIVHLDDPARYEADIAWTALGKQLAEAFWPGPLTLVLPVPAGSRIAPGLRGAAGTVAVRQPAHPVAAELLALAGVPVAAPSANRSGRLSPTEAAHVLESLPQGVLILDGGACEVGVESTVVDATGPLPRLLRPGSITAEQIADLCGHWPLAASEADAAAPSSPGLLASHYAPRLPVRLNATRAENGEALLGFGPGAPEECLNLSAAGDLDEAAHHLFAYLHRLDHSGATGIAVMPIPAQGVGVALNDRLRRAAAPRF